MSRRKPDDHEWSLTEATPSLLTKQEADLIPVDQLGREAVALVDEAERRRKACESVALLALRAGQALWSAKRRVPHGQWGGWLGANWNKSERMAQLLIQLAKQQDKDAQSNPQRVADLPATLRGAMSALLPAPDPIEDAEFTVTPSALPVAPPAVEPDPKDPADRVGSCGHLLDSSIEDGGLCGPCMSERQASKALAEKEDDDQVEIVAPLDADDPEVMRDLLTRASALAQRFDGALRAVLDISDATRQLLTDVRQAKGSSMRVALGHMKPSVLLENVDGELTAANAGVALARPGLERGSAAGKRLRDVLNKAGVA